MWGAAPGKIGSRNAWAWVPGWCVCAVAACRGGSLWLVSCRSLRLLLRHACLARLLTPAIPTPFGSIQMETVRQHIRAFKQEQGVDKVRDGEGAASGRHARMPRHAASMPWLEEGSERASQAAFTLAPSTRNDHVAAAQVIMLWTANTARLPHRPSATSKLPLLTSLPLPPLLLPGHRAVDRQH